MSTQYDVKLIGNLIIDEVYHIPKWIEEGTSSDFVLHRKSIGGLGNMIEPLCSWHSITVDSIVGNDEKDSIEKYLNSYGVTYNFTETQNTSKALILSNLASCEKTSIVNWGGGKELIKISNDTSKWAHIAYLDILSELDFSQIKADIISADVCLSNPSSKTIEKVLHQLQHIDYLFISEKELDPYIKYNYGASCLTNKYGLGKLVFHTKYRTILSSKEGSHQIVNTNEIVDNVDVLGAGDAYCAYFISAKLNHFSDDAAVAFAHENATKKIALRR